MEKAENDPLLPKHKDDTQNDSAVSRTSRRSSSVSLDIHTSGFYTEVSYTSNDTEEADQSFAYQSPKKHNDAEAKQSFAHQTPNKHGRDSLRDQFLSPQKLHEITIIHVADEYGHVAHYPHEDIDQHHRDEVLHQADRNIAPLTVLTSLVDSIKCLVSLAFLLACMWVCTASIATRQTVGTEEFSTTDLVFYIAIFWVLILWLAEMEGSQSCLVGLQPIPKALFRHSHPHAYKSTLLAHRGDNMERFIVGRQFLIVFVVYVTNAMAAPKPIVSIWGLDDRISHFLLHSGIAVTANAVMLGQVAQINAANCMLDFVNTYFGLFTTYGSLFLDATGFLHSVYLVQIVFANLTGKAIESNEPARNLWQNFTFWARIFYSCVLLGYFCAMTLVALYHGQTTMWPGFPDSVSVILAVLLLIFVGILEGMQIALFAVVNLPPDETEKHKWAAKSCELTFSGSNLQSFLIGRQVLVTLFMFILARIMTCDVHMKGPLEEPNIFGISDGLQRFFNTGMPGAVITSLIGSLSWRIIASSFPVAFLNLRLNYWIIYLCLAVEASGISKSTWLLALVQKKIMGYQLDEVYIGTLGDREAAKKASDLSLTSSADSEDTTGLTTCESNLSDGQ